VPLGQFYAAAARPHKLSRMPQAAFDFVLRYQRRAHSRRYISFGSVWIGLHAGSLNDPNHRGQFRLFIYNAIASAVRSRRSRPVISTFPLSVNWRRRVGAIQPSVRFAEIERSRRKRPENLDSYDFVLRAYPKVWSLERSANATEAVMRSWRSKISVTAPSYLSAQRLRR
jgi:hypothetical protein